MKIVRSRFRTLVLATVLFAVLQANQASAGCAFFTSPWIIQYACRKVGAVVRHETDEIDFSGQHLANRDNNSVREVLFEESKLDTFPWNLFKTFPNLRQIEAFRAGLTQLTADTLKYCDSIEILRLSYNSITRLDNDVFNNCKNLQTLELKFNQISTLGNNVFALAQNLNNLDLSNNQLTEIPEELFQNLDSLFIVNLNHNRVSRITSNFFRGSNQFLRLRLAHNEITEIPAGAFANFSIEVLDLNDNQIRNIGAGAFRNLGRRGFSPLLRLNDNKLMRLSSDIFGGVSSNLFELNIRNNQINAVERNFLDFLDSNEILVYATGNVCIDHDQSHWSHPDTVRVFFEECFRNY